MRGDNAEAWDYHQFEIDSTKKKKKKKKEKRKEKKKGMLAKNRVKSVETQLFFLAFMNRKYS